MPPIMKTNAREIAIRDERIVYLLDESGQVIRWNPLQPSTTQVINENIAMWRGWLCLTRDGRIGPFDRERKINWLEGLADKRFIRLGHPGGAAQLVDGTWQLIFDRTKTDEGAKKMFALEKELRKAGPLKEVGVYKPHGGANPLIIAIK